MASENDVIQSILDKDEWRTRLLTGAPYPEAKRPKEDPGKTPEERAAYWFGELRYLMRNFGGACAVVQAMNVTRPHVSLELLRALSKMYRSGEEFAGLRADREEHPRVEHAFEEAEHELGLLIIKHRTPAV